MRGMGMAVLAAVMAVGPAGGAWAQGEPTKNPAADGGNSLINNGAGSGTGTASPGPGMTLKEGKNPTPTASPTANGGNSNINDRSGSGTGTEEPKGAR
jgi:hypothetical protein